MNANRIEKIKDASQMPSLILASAWQLGIFFLNWYLLYELATGLAEKNEMNWGRIYVFLVIASLTGAGIPTIMDKYFKDGKITPFEAVVMGLMTFVVVSIHAVIVSLVFMTENVDTKFFVMNVLNVVVGIIVDVIMGLMGMKFMKDSSEESNEEEEPKEEEKEKKEEPKK